MGPDFVEVLITNLDSHSIRFDRMDCGVWTDRFSTVTSDHRCASRKSGHLDFTSFVSARVLSVYGLSVNCKGFKVDWNDIADAIHLVPRTNGTKKGCVMGVWLITLVCWLCGEFISKTVRLL